MIKKDSGDISKLKARFGGISEDRNILAFKLINEIEFMQGVIQELQDAVKEDGAIILATNGNGFTSKQEHPAQKSYNTMVKNYLSCIKQLNDLLPDSKEEGVKKAGEALKEFIKAG